MSPGELVWQNHCEDEWRFGRMVRGVVRRPYYAEVYYDEGNGWVWFTRSDGAWVDPRGSEDSFEDAIDEAEKVLMEWKLIPKG